MPNLVSGKAVGLKTPPGRLHRDLVSFRLQITFFLGLGSLCWGTMDSFYGRPLLELMGFLLLDGNLVLSGAFLNRSGCREWTQSKPAVGESNFIQ